MAVNDIDPEALERTCARVRETGGPVLRLPGDVSDYGRVQQMAAQAIEGLGNVFGLVNIAGASIPKWSFEPISASIGTIRDANGFS